MKNQYGKGEYNKKPYSPTQGGFTPTGGGTGQQNQQQNKQGKNPQGNRPTQPNNNWGTGSLDKTKKGTDQR